MHSIARHSNMIAIMLYRFESDVQLLALLKHGITHAPDRGVTSVQAVVRLRKLVRRTQFHDCESGDVTNRDVAKFRCVDVNAVLEAEKFANVSASSNAVAEHISIAVLSRSRALRWFESRYFEHLLCLHCDREKAACSSRMSCRAVPARPNVMS